MLGHSYFEHEKLGHSYLNPKNSGSQLFGAVKVLGHSYLESENA